MAINKKVNMAFTASGNVLKKFGLMTRASAKFGKTADKSFRKASRSASRFRDITGGIVAANLLQKAFNAAKRGLFGFITEAAKIEDATAGFTPILGSVERATELVEKLNQTAATTPFQFQGISDVAKQLLPVMNDSIEDTISTFRMLGDTAGGNIQKLDSITRGYTKALLKGKPDMEALNMIAEAGVPIFTEMATSMGITVKQLFEMSKKGKLTSDDLTNAFKRMTGEGGIFFKGMEVASKTFSGKMSTLRDNVALSAASIGSVFLPKLKELADRLIIVAGKVRKWAIENKDLIGTKVDIFISNIKTAFVILMPILKTSFNLFVGLAKIVFEYKEVIFILVGAFAALKTAIFALNIGLAIASFSKFVAIAWSMGGAIGALNTVMALNPIGAAIIGFTALIALFVFLEKKFDLFSTAFDFWVDKAKSFKDIISGFFGDSTFTAGFDPENRGGQNAAEQQAPNKAEAKAAAQQVNIKGQINVNGPAGTTVEDNSGLPGFKLANLGPND